MSSPYVGEIRMFAGNFPPNGWAFCNGALIAISENDTLFNLIGTTYGGDGQETFALPNLQSRVPMHASSSHVIGETGGVESVNLTVQQIPQHNHGLLATAGGQTVIPTSSTNLASATSGQVGIEPFTAGASDGTTLNPASIAATGNGQAHDNMQPYLAVNFIISLFGIYPTQT